MTTWTVSADGESQTVGLGAAAAAAAASSSATAAAASATAAAASATLAANAVSAAAATGSLPGINQCGVMIPFYIYPNNPYSDATVQALLGLIRFYRSVPVTIIINPSSGPGSVWDGNYAAFITLLQGAGAQVVGYVSTAYGARAEQAVKDDILLWTTLYSATPVDGIFLDEQPYATAGGVVDLYVRYTTYAHSLSLYPVVANPGTNQQEAWFSSATADVIVVHETGSWPVESDMAGNFVGGHSNYPQRKRAALVYGQSTLDLTKLRWLRKYVNWVFIDSDSLPNPWDTLPAYLEQLFTALSSPTGEASSVLAFGAKGDGATNDTTAIQAMATALGFVLFSAGNYRMTTTTLDVPVHFEVGAYITVDAANTVTITQVVDSPKQHIFRGSGLVVLSSDSNSGEPSRRVHVSWFGASPASSSQGDQAPAIQKALTAVGTTREAEIEFDFGNYHVFTAMTVNRGSHLKGAGTRRTVIRLNADGFDVFTTTEVACKFSNIQFEVESPLTERLTGAYIKIAHGECEVYDVQCYSGVQGIVVAGNNARIDNIVGTYGTDHAAGSSLVQIASGTGSRVSNVMSGTSTHGVEALVRIGGSSGGAVSGFVVENVQHLNPSASVHVEAFAGNVVRGVIGGIVYNGTAGTAPTYGLKFATSSTFTLSDIMVSGVVINSYATNGILLSQGSSGTMEDISLDGIDITGSSGIGIQFTQSAGTLKDIKVGNTVNVTERATPFGYSGTVAVQIAAMATPNANAPISYTATIADDAVMTIDLQRSVFTGVGIVSVGSSNYGMFLVRAASSPAVTAMTTASTNLNSTTGALTGTTGTDGKVTLSAADKFIYLENRLGSSQALHFTLLTGL